MPYIFDIDPKKGKTELWVRKQTAQGQPFMDDLKLFGKIDSLIQIVHFVSLDIRMEIGIKNADF